MFNWVVKLSFPDGKINYCSSLQFILASLHSVSWGSGEGVWDIPKYAQNDLFTPCTIISPSRRMHVEVGVYVTGCILLFSCKEYLLITVVLITAVCYIHVYVCVVLSILFLKKQERGLLVHHPSAKLGVCISVEPYNLPKKFFQALGQPENLHIDSQHFVEWNYLCQPEDCYSPGCLNSTKRTDSNTWYSVWYMGAELKMLDNFSWLSIGSMWFCLPEHFPWSNVCTQA